MRTNILAAPVLGAAALMVPLLLAGGAMAIPGYPRGANSSPDPLVVTVQGGPQGQTRTPGGGAGAGAGPGSGAGRGPAGPAPSIGGPGSRGPGSGPGASSQGPRDGGGAAGPGSGGPGRMERPAGRGREGGSFGDGTRAGTPRATPFREGRGSSRDGSGRGSRDLGREGASPGDGVRSRGPRGDGSARVPRGDGGQVMRDRTRDRGDRRFDRMRERWYTGPGPRSRDGRRGIRYSWGPGIVFYFRDGWYYGNCRWLRQRAIQTGSRIWWQRWRRCRASTY